MNGRVVAAGVDVVEVARVEKMARRTPAALDRLFGAAERRSAEAIGGPGRAAEGLALFFSLKEAALKALGTGWGQGMGWKDVRILLGRGGRIRVLPSAGARARMRTLGARTFVADAAASGGVAIAAVLLIG